MLQTGHFQHTICNKIFAQQHIIIPGRMEYQKNKHIESLFAGVHTVHISH